MATGSGGDVENDELILEQAADIGSVLRMNPGLYGAPVEEQEAVLDHARDLERAAEWLAEAIRKRGPNWR